MSLSREWGTTASVDNLSGVAARRYPGYPLVGREILEYRGSAARVLSPSTLAARAHNDQHHRSRLRSVRCFFEVRSGGPVEAVGISASHQQAGNARDEYLLGDSYRTVCLQDQEERAFGIHRYLEPVAAAPSVRGGITAQPATCA